MEGSVKSRDERWKGQDSDLQSKEQLKPQGQSHSTEESGETSKAANSEALLSSSPTRTTFTRQEEQYTTGPASIIPSPAPLSRTNTTSRLVPGTFISKIPTAQGVGIRISGTASASTSRNPPTNSTKSTMVRKGLIPGPLKVHKVTSVTNIHSSQLSIEEQAGQGSPNSSMVKQPDGVAFSNPATLRTSLLPLLPEGELTLSSAIAGVHQAPLHAVPPNSSEAEIRLMRQRLHTLSVSSKSTGSLSTVALSTDGPSELEENRAGASDGYDAQLDDLSVDNSGTDPSATENEDSSSSDKSLFFGQSPPDGPSGMHSGAQWESSMTEQTASNLEPYHSNFNVNFSREKKPPLETAPEAESFQILSPSPGRVLEGADGEESQQCPKGKGPLHYPRLPPKFHEDFLQPDLLWKAGGGPVGTQIPDPNTPQNAAPILGDTPPIKPAATDEQANAKAWLEAKEANEIAQARANGPVKMSESAIRLEELVKALKKAGTQKVPKEIYIWKEYADDESNWITDGKFNEIIAFGNHAVEAAFQLGTSQTSSILSLKEENSRLKKFVAELKKDCGLTMGFLSPDKAETLKVRTNYEIESRDNLIKNLRDRLMIEQRPITKELDHANAEVERLNVDLAQCQKKYADSLGDNVQQTNHTGLLRKNILQLEEVLAEERTIIDKLRREIEREKSERELLEERLGQKLAIYESLDKSTTADIRETGSEKNMTDAEKIFEPVCSQLGQTEAGVKQSKVKPETLQNKDENQMINTNNKEPIKGFRGLTSCFEPGWPTAVTPTDTIELQREIDDLKKEYEKLEVRSRQYQTQLEENQKASRERTAILERDVEKRSQHIRILLERLRSFETVGVTSNPPTGVYSEYSKSPDNAITEETQPEAEPQAVDVAILRIKLKLSDMVQQRARHGIQMYDTDEAIEIAQEAVKSNEKAGDDAAVARAHFWCGVALYYSDDRLTARRYFEEADRLQLLPKYEAGYLESWLERCMNVRPEKGTQAYRGKLPQQESHEWKPNSQFNGSSAKHVPKVIGAHARKRGNTSQPPEPYDR